MDSRYDGQDANKFGAVASIGNRRRPTGRGGEGLPRLRSERVERVFMHLCDIGEVRWKWLRGIEEVRKRCLRAALAFNLGRILRLLIGVGKPTHSRVRAERALLA